MSNDEFELLDALEEMDEIFGDDPSLFGKEAHLIEEAQAALKAKSAERQKAVASKISKAILLKDEAALKEVMGQREDCPLDERQLEDVRDALQKIHLQRSKQALFSKRGFGAPKKPDDDTGLT